MNKKLAQKILEDTQANYNRNAEDFSRAREEMWSEADLLSDYINEGDNVLDLGCGNGRYFKALKDKELNYLGIDFSEKLINIAREKFSDCPDANFKTGDVLDLKLPENQFDLVYAFALLHHIPSRGLRLKFLREAKKVLKPDGKLILTVWNVWNFNRRKIIKNNLLKLIGLSQLDFNDIKTSYGGLDKVYVHCFKRKELKKLLEEAGFTVEKTGFLSRRNKEKANIFGVSSPA